MSAGSLGSLCYGRFPWPELEERNQVTKHIGLIGGIGPAATVVYYRAIVRVFAAVKTPLALTIDHADSGVLVSNLNANRADAQATIFAHHAAALKAAGCDIVAVTSIGGHFCRREFDAISPLPAVDAAPAIGEYLVTAGIGRIGVLGTSVVMRSRLYGIPGVEVITPEGDTADRVDTDYKALAQAGAASADQHERLVAAGAGLMARGAEAVLLGGTDLSVVFDRGEVGYPVIDGAVVHAEAIARVALNG